jgi:hypothetical protein
MGNYQTSKSVAQAALDAVAKAGSSAAAAKVLGIPCSTLKDRLTAAERFGLKIDATKDKDNPRLLRKRIEQLEKELKKAETQSDETEILKSAIGTLNSRHSELEIPAWAFLPPKRIAEPGVPTLFISDVHGGEVVRPSEIYHSNEYNMRIMKQRFEYTLKTAIHLLQILDHDMRYPGLVMPLGGDMISGNIHDELMATNELQTMPTLLEMHEMLVKGITLMADTFGSVFLPCVGGNHGRDTKKIWNKQRNHTSFDWLMYQYLAKHFEVIGDKRVNFFIPDGPDAHYKVHNVRYLLTHGDQFRGGDGIIGPIGPLTRGNQKKQARNQAIDMEYDVMICGHWHQYIQLRRLIVNGSIKGYDEYAFSNNFSFEEPQQALWVTNARYGITYRMPVLCEPPAKPSTTEWVSIRR